MILDTSSYNNECDKKIKISLIEQKSFNISIDKDTEDKIQNITKSLDSIIDKDFSLIPNNTKFTSILNEGLRGEDCVKFINDYISIFYNLSNIECGETHSHDKDFTIFDDRRGNRLILERIIVSKYSITIRTKWWHSSTSSSGLFPFSNEYKTKVYDKNETSLYNLLKQLGLPIPSKIYHISDKLASKFMIYRNKDNLVQSLKSHFKDFIDCKNGETVFLFI